MSAKSRSSAEAAGISKDDEIDRTSKLIEEARSQGITIIGAHIGGIKNRAQGAAVGDNTDELSIDTGPCSQAPRELDGDVAEIDPGDLSP